MMIFSQESLPSSTAVLSTVATLTASAVLLRTMAADLLPVEFHDYFFSSFRKLTKCLFFSSQLTVVIEEFEGLTPNHMFESANVYLGTKISPSTHRIKVNKPEKDEELAITVDKNQEIFDFYQGVSFKWVLFLQSSSSTTAIKQSGNRGGGGGEANPRQQELRFFELRFHRKHKEMVLKTYLRYILREAYAIKEERKALKLHTVDYNGIDYWGSVLLNHQATFDTMAMMDVEVKREIIEDLDRFISRKEYYRRVGRAWKRGYLLYGPPGTGKSSLVAAMANYLKFDVYDLDLREVQCNSDLRRLLIGTKNRSILVIEDIDCNVGLLNRESGQNAEDDKITLSGLLNFVDGLWSSCGDERIIVFTTNHKDRLDPALLRPGRMDVHLHMSYCTFSGFKILVYNYLKIQEHPLFGAVEELLVRVEVTPAEVAGELMRSDNAEIALQGLIKYLHSKENKTEVMQ